MVHERSLFKPPLIVAGLIASLGLAACTSIVVVRVPNGTDGGQPGDLPDRADVEATETVEVTTGHVDCIGPWEIHAEYNGDAGRTIAVIVRSQRSGTFVQNIFYQKDGTVEQYYGPEQIPYHLG